MQSPALLQAKGQARQASLHGTQIGARLVSVTFWTCGSINCQASLVLCLHMDGCPVLRAGAEC